MSLCTCLYLFNKLGSNSFYRFGDTFYDVFNMNKAMVVLVVVVVVVVVQSLILTHTLKNSSSLKRIISP